MLINSDSPSLKHVTDDLLQRNRPDALKEERVDGSPGDRPQTRQEQQQLPEPLRLQRVRLGHVLGQSQLSLVLERVHGGLVPQLPSGWGRGGRGGVVGLGFQGGLQQDDSAEAGELGGVHPHSLELGDRLLEGLQLGQGGHVLVGGGSGGSGLHRKGELSGAEDKQLPPRLLQQGQLVPIREGDEGRHVLRPPHVHEEESGGSLAQTLRGDERGRGGGGARGGGGGGEEGRGGLEGRAELVRVFGGGGEETVRPGDGRGVEVREAGGRRDRRGGGGSCRRCRSRHPG